MTASGRFARQRFTDDFGAAALTTRPMVSACSNSLFGMPANVAPAIVRAAPNPRDEHRNRAATSMHPEAVSPEIPSLRDSLDLPSLWLKSAPCPLVSGPVRPSRPLCSFTSDETRPSSAHRGPSVAALPQDDNHSPLPPVLVYALSGPPQTDPPDSPARRAFRRA